MGNKNVRDFGEILDSDERVTKGKACVKKVTKVFKFHIRLKT